MYLDVGEWRSMYQEELGTRVAGPRFHPLTFSLLFETYLLLLFPLLLLKARTIYP